VHVGGGAGEREERRLRVVVVDDNELTLPGFVSALGSSPQIAVVDALNHDQALAWDTEWCAVDALVVDAAEETRAGDQFPGVAVVRRLRAATALLTVRPLVVVVTGHYLHDGLRHRMADADADFFFLRSELRRGSELIDIVLHPERYRRGVPDVLDADRREVLGVRPDTDVEAVVDYVEGNRLAGAFDLDAPERSKPRSRAWNRHREAIATASGLEPMNITTGERPGNQQTPSIRQLRHVWAWASRVKREKE
jgi:CheY-like chemotaxis protein